MKVKYNRVSTLQQSGNRFAADNENYDLVLFDKVSGSVSFNDREQGKILFYMIKEGKIKEVVVEELSRLGRNTGDVVRTLEEFEKYEVNVIIRNMGIQSRVDGKKNAIWKMITSILSSMYEMELENIRERTNVGRQVYLMNGGKLGRPCNTRESEKKFLEKALTKKIIGRIKENRSVMEISKYLECSSTTVVKTRRIAKKYGLIK